MKKFFILAFAATMIAFASCGNKTTTQADSVDSTEVGAEVEAVAAEADSIAKALDTQLQGKDAKGLETTIQNVQKTYAELVANGKIEEAKAYASKVKEFLEEKSEAISTLTSGNATITSIINTVKSLPTTAETTAEEAAAAVKSDVNNAVESTKAAAAERVEAAKQEAA